MNSAQATMTAVRRVRLLVAVGARMGRDGDSARGSGILRIVAVGPGRGKALVAAGQGCV